MNMLDEARNFISLNISGEKRLKHILSVEKEIIVLAKYFELDENTTNKLRFAALMHDITKEFSFSEQIEFLNKRGIEYSEYNVKCPKTLHAISGAYLAKELYPEFVDDEVFGSILYHTTGKVDMTLSEKLVYLADYIEEERTFSDCVELRKFFYGNIGIIPKEENLEKTLIISFDMTLKNIIDENNFIHPDTVAARNHLLMNIKEA